MATYFIKKNANQTRLPPYLTANDCESDSSILSGTIISQAITGIPNQSAINDICIPAESGSIVSDRRLFNGISKMK